MAFLLLALMIVGCTSSDENDDIDPDDLLQPSENVLHTPAPVEGYEPIYETFEGTADDFRAVWVASVLNLDFPSGRDLTAAAMKREIDTIVSRTAELGLNVIIFQVRPTGDSFYESDIFPWSHWLSGTQGQGIPDFDPLAYWIEICHDNSIELHAWLNPYRIIHTSANSSDPGTLAPNNPVYQRPELAVGWSTSGGSSGLFLDPGLPEARQLIIDGVEEIITKYDVDGIHIDDYFYPGTNFDDTASYALYGEEMDLADWRRKNVNTLIQGIGTVIRQHNQVSGKNVRWGVSPTAIWKNGSSDPLGVPTTRGQESYHELYADTRLWVTEEWVDYICPQIYWYIGFETADFEAVLNWWIDLCSDYDVDLYVGHAAYREDENNQPPHWQGEMIRQLEMVAASDEVSGSAFYRFHSLRGPVGHAIRDFYVEEEDLPQREPIMVLEKLSVGMPSQNVTITGTASSAPGYNIVGTSVPDKPLFLNGEEVTNRTVEGFFFIYVSLDSGANEFTFSQDGQDDVTRRITRNAPGGGGGSGDPSPPTTITEVTTARYATIASDEAWVYSTNSNSGGSGWMLSRGQQDRVVAESGNGYVKLSSGVWVNRNAVTLSNESTFTENVLRNGVYRAGTNYDVLVWRSDVFVAANASFDGRTLKLSFGMQTRVPHLTIPNDLSRTIFESVRSGMDGNTPFYEFVIRDDVNYEGHFVEYEGDEFRFYLKKRKTLAPGDLPLTGITIMLDPGHGGSASGAIGPLGMNMPEKELTLINSLILAERLEALGAIVHLTRDTDVDLSLQERVNMSWEVKPDLFISLHINSVAETTNATNIRGFTVWYRNPNAIDAAQTTLEIMHDINPNTNRQPYINHSNFFVCRPAWTPSVLYEAGFIINIDDFVWLIDPAAQSRMADATVDVILEYFSG